MTHISLKMVKLVILSKKIVVILSVAQLVTTVIFFSAWDKSRVKWDNSRNSTQKTRTLLSSSLILFFFSTFIFQIRFLNKNVQLWITVIQTGNPTQHFLSSLRRKLDPVSYQLLIFMNGISRIFPLQKKFLLCFSLFCFLLLQRYRFFFITGRGSFYGVRTQFISPPFPFWGGNGIHIHLELWVNTKKNLVW